MEAAVNEIIYIRELIISIYMDIYLIRIIQNNSKLLKFTKIININIFVLSVAILNIKESFTIVYDYCIGTFWNMYLIVRPIF